MHTISFSIKYWSRGTVQSLFLRHEGYLGAIGAFLKGTEECGKCFDSCLFAFFIVLKYLQMVRNFHG
jgi:hypothetical protein